jgi:hypothetical protein
VTYRLFQPLDFQCALPAFDEGISADLRELRIQT